MGRDEQGPYADASRRAVARTVALPATPRSSLAARTFAERTLAQWGVGAEVSDDVLLVVDELVTNAVLHARAPITLVLDLQARTVRIEVTDPSPLMPTARSRSATRTSGRGLTIIEAISGDWGTRQRVGGGKSVWADVNRTPVAR